MKNYILILLIIFISQIGFAKNHGTVTVVTDPPDVEVWLGSRFLGNTPINKIPLPTGSYKLRLTSPLFHTSVTENIDITRDNETIVERKIKNNFGAIKINSTPTNAEVTISSILGKTPLSTERMTPGRYKLIVSPEQGANYFYLPDTLDLKVEPGKTSESSIILKKRKILDRKFLLRGVLGVAAIGGFVWAIVENGKAHDFEKNAGIYLDQGKIEDSYSENSNAKKARIFRNIGIIAGSVSVVGFEIVAFF